MGLFWRNPQERNFVRRFRRSTQIERGEHTRLACSASRLEIKERSRTRTIGRIRDGYFVIGSKFSRAGMP